MLPRLSSCGRRRRSRRRPTRSRPAATWRTGLEADGQRHRVAVRDDRAADRLGQGVGTGVARRLGRQSPVSAAGRPAHPGARISGCATPSLRPCTGSTTTDPPDTSLPCRTWSATAIRSTVGTAMAASPPRNASIGRPLAGHQPGRLGQVDGRAAAHRHEAPAGRSATTRVAGVGDELRRSARRAASRTAAGRPPPRRSCVDREHRRLGTPPARGGPPTPRPARRRRPGRT
jgi:hypothetical protein